MAEERMLNDEILLGLIKANSGGGGGGTTDYEDLDNKPQIGGVTLSGNKSLSDLGVQEKLTAGMYININSGTISVKRDVSEDVDEVLTLTHDTSGGTNKINAVLTVGGETIDSDTFTTAGGTFHDMVQISFNTRAVRFMFKYLVASKTQSAGYENYIYNEYTDTFVETIGEESKLIIKSELDTALSGKQDTLTFDSVPTNGSTNPVESNGVYDALATKQDATDNSLETEAKTIVGAINENAGDIGSLKSGLTTLDNEVNGDATTYPYADVITIEDAVPSNLADCNVKIEPVQDLHGYDKPWVGGAGKNKLPLVLADIKTANTDGTWNDNVYTVNNGTFTVNTDSDGNVVSIKANGTFNANSFIIIEKGNLQKYNGMILNGCPSGGSGSTYNIKVQKATGDYAIYATDTGNGYTLPDSITSDNAIVYISINSGYNAQNLMFYPMLRLATETDATFAPYTNICPITGHTEVDVQRDGKNLFDVNGNYINRQGAGGTYTVSGNSITVTSSTQTSAFAGFIKPLEVGETYTISYTSTSKIRILQIDEPITVITQGYYGSDTDSGTSFVASKPYVLINCVGNTSGVTYSNIQLEKGSSPTDYEPYHGKTYTIALGDTIYGGTVDFDSGVMTVDRAYAEFDGSDDESWNVAYNNANMLISGMKSGDAMNGISNIFATGTSSGTIRFGYNNNNVIYIQGVDTLGISDVEGWKTFLSSSNLQIVYPLATPFTVQLTPQQIQLLKGQNTLTASTGQISVTVNGVSGSIGALTEDVAGLQSGLDEQSTSHVVLSIPANTYNTREAALTAMYTTYNALSSDKKRRAYIIWGDTVYRNGYMPNGYFSAIFPRWDDGSSAWISQIIIIDLEHANMLSSLLGASGTTTTNLKANAQDVDVSLCY